MGKKNNAEFVRQLLEKSHGTVFNRNLLINFEHDIWGETSERTRFPRNAFASCEERVEIGPRAVHWRRCTLIYELPITFVV